MFFYIFVLALIIVTIILIIYIIFPQRDVTARKKISTLLRLSNGGFDEPARESLTTLEHLDAPDAMDFFRHGNIIRYNLIGNNAQTAGPEIDIIVADYTNALENMAAGDTTAADINPHTALHIMNEFLNLIIHDTTTFEQEIQAAIVQSTLHNATSNSTNRKQSVDNCFDESIQYTNDPQNVHDSKVSADLRDTLDILAQSHNNASPSASIREMRAYSQNKPNNNKAFLVLDKIQQADTISTFNLTEDHIFSLVWERAKHPSNEANREPIRAAIFNALLDCIEHDTLVCINGRCGRIIAALATLDFDSRVGYTMTYEAYRNQIFEEIKQLISLKIATAANSVNTATRNVALSYEDPSITPDPEAEKIFKADLSSEISSHIRKYSDKMKPAELQTLTDECLTYASI